MTLLLRWLAVILYNSQIADYLERFHHYRHHGDQRYFSAATRNTAEMEGMLAAYSGLQVIANPPQISRWIWLCSRLIANYGRAGINHHNIDIYEENWLTGEHHET
ncbi:MAG: triacylglycerol lipase [Psychromonas sp.]|jgi:hypothetical protein